MPRKVSRLESNEQPIAWLRAFVCGMYATIVMTGFIDTFYMTGFTPFSYELYLGSLIRGTMYGDANWTFGFIANLLFGGMFGFLYGYAFEYFSRRATARIGTSLGLGHAIIAAVAIFPFFNIMHQQMDTGLYPHFGFFGSGLGAPTPILLLMGNLLFGATMGLLYGPVRAARVRTRFYEPGEVGGRQGEVGVITDAEDAVDRPAV